jgi:hypothetical protein
VIGERNVGNYTFDPTLTLLNDDLTVINQIGLSIIQHSVISEDAYQEGILIEQLGGTDPYGIQMSLGDGSESPFDPYGIIITIDGGDDTEGYGIICDVAAGDAADLPQPYSVSAIFDVEGGANNYVTMILGRATAGSQGEGGVPGVAEGLDYRVECGESDTELDDSVNSAVGETVVVAGGAFSVVWGADFDARGGNDSMVVGARLGASPTYILPNWQTPSDLIGAQIVPCLDLSAFTTDPDWGEPPTPALYDGYGSDPDTTARLYAWDNAGTLELRVNIKGNVTTLATE